MFTIAKKIRRSFLKITTLASGLMATFLMLATLDAQALPLFARQTGQNCVACHAGGQFPELTPYGRMFKLTGYTYGERVSVPLSVMAYASYTKVSDTSKSDEPSVDFQFNGAPVIGGGSVFTGGKITDNLGAFVQWTYDNFASANDDGSYSGHVIKISCDKRYDDVVNNVVSLFKSIGLNPLLY